MGVPLKFRVLCCALIGALLSTTPAEAQHRGGGGHGHNHGGPNHGGGGWNGGGWNGGGFRGGWNGGLGGWGSNSFFSSNATVLGYGSGLTFGGFGYSPYLPGYNFNSFNIYNGYPYAANGIWGPYSNYGPLYLPANQLFGPQTLPGWSPPQALNNPVAPAFGQANQGAPQPVAQPAAQEQPKPRVPSNDEALKRAFKFLDFGDQLFAQQKFLEAYLRYQSAASAAPDLSDAYFRRGFALLALGHYDRAAEAMRRGVTLNREWSKSPFRLDDLYADNRVAKQAHQEQLARTLEKEPENANAMFLLGVMLYFDDQQERSRPFLQKALQLMKTQEGLPPAWAPADPVDRNQPEVRPGEGKGAQPPPVRPGELEF